MKDKPKPVALILNLIIVMLIVSNLFSSEDNSPIIVQPTPMEADTPVPKCT